MDTRGRLERPDLTGKKLGGVRLHRMIGSGGFGDVYIDRSCRVVVKVLWRECDPVSYRRECEAVSRVAAKVRAASHITKIVGMGEDGALEYYPSRGDTTDASRQILKYPTVTERFLSFDDELPPDSRRCFYYLMTAADNRLPASRGYEPDTLATRKEHGELDRLSAEEEADLSTQMIDALLDLFRMGFSHGDLKLSNIFFVNGQISLGDIGCTLYYPKPGSRDGYYKTENYAPTSSMFLDWLNNLCGGDELAANMLKDIFMLGRTIRFLKGSVEELIPENENGLLSLFEEAPLLALELETFAIRSDHWDPELICRHLRSIREACSSAAPRDPKSFLQPAALLEIDSVREFRNEWTVLKELSPFSMLVARTLDSSLPLEECDILLAERVPSRELQYICETDALLVLDQDESKEKILSIYRLPKSLILLTHAPDCNGKSVHAFFKRRFRGYSVAPGIRHHGEKTAGIYWTTLGSTPFKADFEEFAAGLSGAAADTLILALFRGVCEWIKNHEYRSYGDVCAKNMRILPPQGNHPPRLQLNDIHENDRYLEPDEPEARTPSLRPPKALRTKMERAAADPEAYRILLDFYGLCRTLRECFPELSTPMRHFCDGMESFCTAPTAGITGAQIVSRLKHLRYRIFTCGETDDSK